jgi:hypothetical protein
MLNSGKTDTATVINLASGKIFIWPTMIMSGTIRVINNNGLTLWQKTNCMAEDLVLAISICNAGLQTNVFQT